MKLVKIMIHEVSHVFMVGDSDDNFRQPWLLFEIIVQQALAIYVWSRARD